MPVATIDAVATVVVAGLLAIAALAGMAVWRRHGRRSVGTELSSASQPTDDVHYPYYLAAEEIRGLAGTFKFVLPEMREVTNKRGWKLLPGSAGFEGGRESTATIRGQINLPALGRALRERAGPAHLAVDVGRVPDEFAADLRGQEGRDAMVAEKRRRLQAVAEGNRLVIIRGYFQQSRRETGQDGSSRIALELTHLSAQVVAEDKPADDPAALVMPRGVAVVIALPSDACRTAAGQERFERDQPFFGEIIAHSPSFDERTGVFTCAAYAVWGCIKPQSTSGYGTAL